jgi:hypothetical protein
MHQATIYVNPTLPDEIGFSQAMGVPGDVRFYFKSPDGTPYVEIADLNPQLVMRPFTSSGIFGYDINVNDVVGASGIATIPGSAMNDRFNIEVYTRNADKQPLDLLACGRVDLTGYGYAIFGPLSPASYSVGPSGPAGPMGPRGVQGEQGIQGIRGSRWYTGMGDPNVAVIPDARIEGDMWLDEASGDVWRWSSGAWGAFKGTQR